MTISRPHQWILEHLDYPHADCCLIWPFARRAGYGSLTIDCETHSAHRLMCEMKNGPPPTSQHVAAHSCGRGHDACVNPHHVSWKTPSENQFDRQDGKGKRKRSKLTEEIAAEIRSLAGKERAVVTAERYGVSESSVRQVQTGKTWGPNRTDRRRRIDLTTEQVVYIRQMNGKKKQQEIADELGVSLAVVSRVVTGRAYASVTQTTGLRE